MKPKEQRKEDPEAAEKPAAPESAQGRAPEEPAAPKPKFEFKILPANPRNAFDFEDVADK